MSTRKYYGDLATYTVGGTSLIDSLSDAVLTVNAGHDEGKGMARLHESPQLVVKGFSLEATATSNVAGVGRVTNLNLTAFTVGGTAYLATVDSVSFSGSMAHAEGKGAADFWEFPNVVSAGFSGKARLKVPAADLPALDALAADATVAGNYLAISATLNGVVVTIPVAITMFTRELPIDDIQYFSIDFVGRDPLTGTYPTAPTGTTSLLEKAIVQPRTALAFTFKPSADSGTYSGNLVWSAWDFSVNNTGVVRTKYSWKGAGTLGYAAPA